jgi:hypothetical protein
LSRGNGDEDREAVEEARPSLTGQVSPKPPSTVPPR